MPEPPERPEVTVDIEDARRLNVERRGELVPLPRPGIDLDLELEEGRDPARQSDVDQWGRSEHLRGLTRSP